MTNKKNTMDMFRKTLYHYFVGVLISASLIALIVLFDYYINGYLQYPELEIFIKVSLMSGIGFGVAHFASRQFKETNKKK